MLSASVDAETFEGGCACGGVRYRLTSAPVYVHCCHCRSCQRESGSAFALNAMIESDRVNLLKGEPELVPTPADSGNDQKFFRCSECKVAVWSNYAMATGDKLSFVRVGTLDEPDRIQPDVHIFTDSKQPWVEVPDGALSFPVYYDRQEVWPPEALARFNALL